MNTVMQARGLLGGRPHRQSWAEIQVGRNQSLATVIKIKKKKSGGSTAKRGVTSKEANLIKGLVNLEYGI